MTKRLGIAIFGLGRIGQIHLENLLVNPNYEICYLCDVNESHANSIKARYNLSAKAVGADAFADVFADKRVDCVIVGTPTDTHEGLCEQALKSGKHVFCEKPLAMTLESSLSIIELAKEKNLKLLVAFNRRFDPQILRVKAETKSLGKLFTVKTTARDAPRPPISYLKISGGIFHDCAVHDLDLLRFMLGEEPETVYTSAHAHDPEIAELNDADTVFMQLKFPSGALGHIELGRDARYGYDQTVEIFGEKGKAISANQQIAQWQVWKAEGQSTDAIKQSFKQRYHDAYVAELEEFHAIITGDKQDMSVVPADCLRVSVLAEAAEESWRTGQVVDIKNFTEKMLEHEKVDSKRFHAAL